MTAPLALALVGALLVVTVAAGLWIRQRSGRPGPVSADAAAVDAAAVGADALGDTATLLQFSTRLCSRCPGTRRVLSAIADSRTGVRHLDVDLTDRPDLARRFAVLQTPTTLVLDGDGVIRSRISGVPRPDAVASELDRLIGAAR